jgi:Domain of unknown function (DUF5667)
MGRPNQTHERLDALLDGQTGEVTDDLAALLEAAEALRAELAEFQLDPEVADRHLEQVLNSAAPVVSLPVRQRGKWGLRRRVAAVALAAALVLVPATMASASALPGQALYPVKLAVEQVRLASVQWSATREAAVRTGLADKRVSELDRLVELQRLSQIPPAIRRVHRAMVAATEAINQAVAEGADLSEVAEVASQLQEVKQEQVAQLQTLFQRLPPTSGAALTAIRTAIRESPPPPPPVIQQPPPVAPPVTGPQADPPAGPPSNSQPEQPPPPPVTDPDPPGTAPEPQPPVTTAPPAPDPTQPPPPTPTTVPTTTVAPEPPSGAGAGKSEAGSPPTSGP